MNLNEKNNVDKEISLVDIWHIIRSNIKFIFLFTMIFIIGSSVFTFLIATPKYRSDADVMIQVEKDSSSSEANFDLVNAFRLIDTVAELMEKEVILMNTVERLIELGYEKVTVESIKDGLIISSSTTSYFINISFVDEDTSLSKDAVDAVIDSVIEETNIENAFPVLTDKIRRTSFASEAVYDSPNRVLSIFIGGFLGAIISVGFVMTKEALSTHFRSKEEVEEYLNLQVLAVIPLMKMKEKKNEKK